MYGFPLTIYILSTFFGIKIPFIRIKGHLWATLSGLGDQGAILEMAIGVLVMYLGMGLVIIGWWKIQKANGELLKELLRRFNGGYLSYKQLTAAFYSSKNCLFR